MITSCTYLICAVYQTSSNRGGVTSHTDTIVKVKEVNLYSAFIVVGLPHTQGAQVRITQCYLQITPYVPLPRKHLPDGASPDWVADI